MLDPGRREHVAAEPFRASKCLPRVKIPTLMDRSLNTFRTSSLAECQFRGGQRPCSEANPEGTVTEQHISCGVTTIYVAVAKKVGASQYRMTLKPPRSRKHLSAVISKETKKNGTKSSSLGFGDIVGRPIFST